MRISELLDQVLASQAPSGAFRSTVQCDGKSFADENGFITALVLRELGRLPASFDLFSHRERALDFLEACESLSSPGAFHFYPPGNEPQWMGTRLAPDADDTALIVLELLKHRRVSQEIADRIIDEVLEPHRLHYRPGDTPDWARQGAYKTWLDISARPNPIDCCVNANVAALLKFSGRDHHTGYKAACETVLYGVRCAGSAPRLARMLTPYYPQPVELLYAMRRALAVGVKEFGDVADGFSRQQFASVDMQECWPRQRPICGSLGGKVFWTCPALQIARQITSMIDSPYCSLVGQFSGHEDIHSMLN
jgi:hypothetical protein